MVIRRFFHGRGDYSEFGFPDRLLLMTVYSMPFSPRCDRYRQTSFTGMEAAGIRISESAAPAGTEGFLTRVICGKNGFGNRYRRRLL